MASTKTTTLTFRIEPRVQETLRAAARQEHRAISSIVEALIRDCRGRHDIAIPAQGHLFGPDVTPVDHGH